MTRWPCSSICQASKAFTSRRTLVPRQAVNLLRMASVDQRPAAVGARALFNPRTYGAEEFDEATRRGAAGDDRVLRVARQGDAQGARPRPHLVRGLPRVRQARARLRDAADARRRGRRRPGQALGHRRICAFNEITGFYGLPYWYTWQVSILGLGPIWQSENAAARQRAAELLEDGAIFAFGLSEKEHGADIYSTDMVLTPDGDGLPRQRRQVLHRQRQPRRHGVGVRPPRRRRGRRRLRLLRRRQPAPAATG